MWDLPGPGLEPMSPVLAGGFLTTVPPGKSPRNFYMRWETRRFVWLALLWYLLDCGGLESNLQHLWGIPVLCMRWESNGSLWQHPPSWGSQALTPRLSLSPQGEITAQKVTLGTELCRLQGGVTWIKSGCSSYPIQCIQSCIFLPPAVCWNFPAGLQDQHKGSLVCGQLSNSVSSGGSWTPEPRGAGVVHRPLQCPELGPGSVCLLLDAPVGESPPGSLGVGACDRTRVKQGCSQLLRVRSCFQVYRWDHSRWVSCTGVSLPSQNGSPRPWAEKARNGTSWM